MTALWTATEADAATGGRSTCDWRATGVFPAFASTMDFTPS